MTDQFIRPYANTAVADFAERLQGTLIQPGDADYDEARAVWNGMIDRYPALIARCADVDDVVASINFARENRLPLAVRGGGHNVAGHGTVDDGLVIDLSGLKQITVDPEARRATAQGGVTWGELDAATQVYGLATPGGVFSDTGIAGLTLGGGFGWLTSKYGLACDNLVGAQVVTADGRIIHASETENRELLWGLRGGGGNFGVVTTFEYQLHPVGPEVAFMFVLHDGEGDKTAEGLRRYRDFCASAPDEVSTLAFIGVVPPHGEMFPEEIHGKPFIGFGGLYVGPVEEGQRIFEPMRTFAEPLLDASDVMPFVDAQKAFDEDYPNGMRYYWKSTHLMRLDDEVIEKLVAHARRQPSVLSTTDVWNIRGKLTQFGPEHSAFNTTRHAPFMINPEANWEDPADDEANVNWVWDLLEAMRPYSDGGLYMNFAGFQEEGNALTRRAFGSQYERLAALKRQYDPDNLFRLNHNIPPK